jgi:phosphatidylinositol alpha-1,6-mannosyltransferase
VRLLGPVEEDRLALLHGCADVFVMLCRDRWFGLEREGFGIVFLEAAACGVPQVAGESGGAAEALGDGETGVVVRRPFGAADAAAAIAPLLDDPDLRQAMGVRSRSRVTAAFSHELLANRLLLALTSLAR